MKNGGKNKSVPFIILFSIYIYILVVGRCDEWGGAESRGNGARPVE